MANAAARRDERLLPFERSNRKKSPRKKARRESDVDGESCRSSASNTSYAYLKEDRMKKESNGASGAKEKKK